MDMLRGFDVSHHQGSVNFAAAKAGGHTFVVVKATESTGYVDPTMAANRKAAHAAGLTVGLYHYAGSSTARQVYDATTEARWFIRQVGALQPGEIVVLDFEPANPPPSPVAWAKTWLDTVTAALGVRPLIYLNKSEMNGYDWRPVSGSYALWLATYDGSTAAPTACNCWSAAAMKQYSDRGTVPGVAAPCDVNVFYGSSSQLAAYGAGGDDMPTAQEIADAVWSYPLHSQSDPRGDWGGRDRLAAIDRGVALVLEQLTSTAVGTLNGDLRPDLAAKQQVLEQMLTDVTSLLSAAQPAGGAVDLDALAVKIVQRLTAVQFVGKP